MAISVVEFQPRKYKIRQTFTKSQIFSKNSLMFLKMECVLGPIWYHSEPPDIPYSPNQFLDRDFFVTSYSKCLIFCKNETCVNCETHKRH